MVTIIAEAGVNHNGDLSRAKKLVDQAYIAGADYVKFQTFKAEKLVSIDAPSAEYQMRKTSNFNISQLELLKKLELSEKDHYELITHCSQLGIKFLTTAFDVEGLDFLKSLNLETFKIPSGEITNLPYLKKVASFEKPVIISTGMANSQEVKQALQIITQKISKEDVTILHCNTEYPTPLEDVNLKAMTTMQKEFGVKIGYSDHTKGIETPIAAVALGATIIEKHFTLDKSLPGPDHKASLTPKELKQMVKCIRNTSVIIQGDGQKKASKSEITNKNIVRKSIFTRTLIEKGQIFRESDLKTLRPGDGLCPMKYWESIIGKKATKTLLPDTKLKISDFE